MKNLNFILIAEIMAFSFGCQKASTKEQAEAESIEDKK